MHSVKSLVQSILHQSSDWRMLLIAQWPHIVGDIAQHACIEKIEGDTLIIGVHSAVWMQELYLLSSMVQSKVNQALEKPYIKKVHFKYRQRHTIAHTIKKNLKTPTASRPLNGKEQIALNAMHDNELRTQLHKFLLRCQHEAKS